MSTKMPPIIPHLFVSNAAAAIDFYKRAFGARELTRHAAPNSTKIMHASLEIQGGMFMLSDEFPEFTGGRSETPEALGGSPVMIHLNVSDVDATFNAAVGAGATTMMPVQETFWGARYGQLRDPFGHSWSLSTPTRAVSQDEMEQGARKVFGQHGS